MSPSCPISTRRVDSNMVRIISFQVAIFTVILLFTQESIFALVLLFDFFMRTIRRPNLSPFYLVATLYCQDGVLLLNFVMNHQKDLQCILDW